MGYKTVRIETIQVIDLIISNFKFLLECRHAKHAKMFFMSLIPPWDPYSSGKVNPISLFSYNLQEKKGL